LEAIEIYQKILEVVKGQNYQDVTTAMNFAQNKINEHYWRKQDGMNRAGGQLLSSAYTCDAAVKQNAQMIDYKVLED